MRIAILIVATNKYLQFVAPLIESAQEHLLAKNPTFTKKYFVFTNDISPTDYDKILPLLPHIEFCYIDHYPFPYPTLFRFQFFQKYSNLLFDYDQIIYVDADALFVAPVNEEVLGPRIAVQHCGFVDERGSYERNNKSVFYVKENEGQHYYGGGFWSFSRNEFVSLMRYCNKNLEIDMSNRIIPVWHDETMINRYLIDNKPTRILSPSYHYPEPPNEAFIKKWEAKNKMFDPKIMMLNKDHKELRK